MQMIEQNSRTSQPLQATNSIELDAIVDVLWDDTYKNGFGVNAVTGQTSGMAVESFEVPLEQMSTTSSEFGRWIANRADYELEIATSVSGKYNIEGTSVSASSDYLSHIKYSQTSMTLIAKYIKENQEYDLPKQLPTLTSQASELMEQDPEKFRSLYGDYFVEGFKRMSRFTGAYVCTSRSVSEMESFASAVKVVTNIWSASGAAEFSRLAEQHNIEVEYSIYQAGLKPNVVLPTPESAADVLEALNIFKLNEVGVKYFAYLAHYGTLQPKYSRVIPYSPDAFVELKVLYTLAMDVDERFNNCPEPYKALHKPSYTELKAKLQAYESELITDNEIRDTLTEAYRELFETLNDVFTRQDFFYAIRDAQSEEPATDKKMYAEGNRKNKQWKYGESDALSNAIVISSDSMTMKKNYKFGNTGKKKGYLTWEQDADRLYVGWKVQSKKDDNGNWRKKTDGTILLNDEARFYFQGQELRGINWIVTVYYVDAKAYQFQV